ncbi:hypothetical protein HHE02_01910 [Helicobacter heilmannii]|uniref:Uncharacterized protein n=1 Tax=Helicobacter heilmannii TaxID=35817 RepID=A0A0K2XHM7_HELHE|nr:hypothetical protein BN341_9170 [Helicobacter heilmannii ASB1.4]CCM73504.1 hypothetical protein BN341_9200 [Helicobacter heilmannii ASB1.4]CRF45118.1 hypothetical protein HHE014_00690 [Helicobacter heilmannii]CRF46911.1 hypothetical protein HHE02_01910 [Helicobacter heilmannii]CRI35070.1 hypothetical protein HHE01_00680 [Helicobacter heilmannii]
MAFVLAFGVYLYLLKVLVWQQGKQVRVIVAINLFYKPF